MNKQAQRDSVSLKIIPDTQKLSKLEQPIWHKRSSLCHMAKPGHHVFELESPIETIKIQPDNGGNAYR